MRSFQFRLNRVLSWRRKKCQIEENRLAACFTLVRATELKIERLQAERASIDGDLLSRAAIPAPDLLNLNYYRLRARKQHIDLTSERRQRLLAVSEQLGRVQKARRNVKLLEKMRERQWEEHTLLAGRELEQTAGENYLARWSRSRRPGAGEL